MLEPQLILTFLAASVLLGLSPGPDNLFVLTQSALYGRPAGLAVTVGLCTGLIVHTLAVAVGVAALVQSSAAAFNVLKLVGAAYLLYLAWQVLRAQPVDLQAGNAPALSSVRLYFRGIVMNVTNPKVSIFFLAFLPQFTDPSRGPVVAQLLMLGGLFILATVVVFGSIAIAAGAMRARFASSPGIQRWLNRIAGIVFVGLALRLALTQR